MATHARAFASSLILWWCTINSLHSTAKIPICPT